MNDNWHKTLTKISEKSPAEAVINAWWDYGAWFKMVARRRVIFDGQSQNTPQAYWMATCLLAQNEEEALRILAMLNNGGNRAYEVINDTLKDPLKSVLFLKKVIALPPEAAKSELLTLLPTSQAAEVVHLLFDRPPAAYFIVDNSLCGKMGSISYLASWDFSKAYLAKKSAGPELDKAKEYLLQLEVREKSEIENFTTEAALAGPGDLENLVSRRLSIQSRMLKGEEADGIVLFEKGFVFRPKEERVYLYSPRLERFRIPKSLLILEDNHLKKVVYPHGDFASSLLIFKDQEGYKAVLLDTPLADSLFVRLYFLQGAGLKHFKPFLEERSQDGYIRVFEVVWE
jgi:dolichyl-diphosphooligosaccharide--protein glycosyltransferase